MACEEVILQFMKGKFIVDADDKDLTVLDSLDRFTLHISYIENSTLSLHFRWSPTSHIVPYSSVMFLSPWTL